MFFMNADDDWRMQASTRLAKDWKSPWTGEIASAGNRVFVINVVQLNRKKTLVIPLPNATAIFLSSASRSYKDAQKIRRSSKIDRSLKKEVSFLDHSAALDYFERMMESIVMAYSSLESFANATIPDDYQYEHHRKSELILEVYDKIKIERYVSLDDKLSKILPDVLECKSPKGHDAWTQFRNLKKIRDRVIHMKSSDRRSSGPERKTVWDSIVLTGPPHIMARTVMGHFVTSMTDMPKWYEECPI